MHTPLGTALLMQRMANGDMEFFGMMLLTNIIATFCNPLSLWGQADRPADVEDERHAAAVQKVATRRTRKVSAAPHARCVPDTSGCQIPLLFWRGDGVALNSRFNTLPRPTSTPTSTPTPTPTPHARALACARMPAPPLSRPPRAAFPDE